MDKKLEFLLLASLLTTHLYLVKATNARRNNQNGVKKIKASNDFEVDNQDIYSYSKPRSLTMGYNSDSCHLNIECKG